MATFSRWASRGLGLLTLWTCCIAVRPAPALTPPPAPDFELQLTTNRGCLEDGDNPIYLIGQPITVSFRIGSPTAASANATIFDILANGQVSALSFGAVSTNQTRAVSATVGPPTGVEHLTLRASRIGYSTTRRTCSFVVASSVTPGPTRTRTPTRTPTVNPPITATPANALSGEIRTNRGCNETGDNPVFAVGDAIAVSYRINSARMPKALASIRDNLPGDVANLFSFGLVQTNVPHQFDGRIAPPMGLEVLELRGAPPFGSAATLAECSFTVVGRPAVPTRTPTPSRTAAPMASVTATPTPTNVVPCVGACTQAGLVTISDILVVVEIANGTQNLSACPEADAVPGQRCRRSFKAARNPSSGMVLITSAFVAQPRRAVAMP